MPVPDPRLDLGLDLAALAIVARVPDLRVRLGDGAPVTVRETAAVPGDFAITVDGRAVTGQRCLAGDQIIVRIAGRTHVVRAARAAVAARARDGREDLRADMPGTVVAVHVALGQRVAAGDPLITIESMKLQATLHAEREATIAALPIAANATFDRGAVLAVLEEIQA